MELCVLMVMVSNKLCMHSDVTKCHLPLFLDKTLGEEADDGVTNSGPTKKFLLEYFITFPIPQCISVMLYNCEI